MIMLHMRHIHAGGYCSRGARAWCERHNINYMEFLQHGIAVERIEASGDAFALHVCRLAREEYAAQHTEVNNG